MARKLDIQALPYIVLLGFFFGSSFIAARVAVGQFGTINYVFIRLLLASLIFGAVYLFDRRRPWPTDAHLWRHGIVLGVLATAVPMLSFNSALNYLSSGVTSVFRATEPAVIVYYNIRRFGATAKAMTTYIIPIVATLGGVLILDEKLTPGMLAGMGLIIGGIAIVNLQKRRTI